MPPKRPAASASIADTRLGLAAEELALFRQHRSIALGQAPRTSGATTTTHHVNATAQLRNGGTLDSTGLQLMTTHFDRVMMSIQQRLEALHRDTRLASQRHARQQQQAQVSVQAANAEIARMHSILRQIDELETEFDKIRRIRDIVRTYRARIEDLDRRLGG